MVPVAPLEVSPRASAAATRAREAASLIEVGWVVIGELSPAQRRAVEAAREEASRRLRETFPGFSWRMPRVSLPAPAGIAPDEPADRLHEGVQARDARSWDFALVVTPRDLRSYYKSYALAVPSRALSVAVLSLARLAASDDADVDRLAHRVASLALHLLGDLNGLRHRAAANAVMQAPRVVSDLDLEREFDVREREALRAALVEVGDLRLEETSQPPPAFRFYLRAGCERAGEIVSAVLRARPWALPLRLSRLTAAAVSALFVLLVTAEVWDLGTSQRPIAVGALSLLVLVGTTAFVLARQRLVPRGTRGRISEQSVVMNVSAVLVVAIGMLTTYAALFGLTLGVGLALFGHDLLARWAPAMRGTATWGPLLAMAGLVSSLGLLIGSLGASFEGNDYFRHVIYADEET